MKNPKNPKERGLLKGAMRRVFSRSEVRRRALDKALVKDYSDPSRKRVTRWGKCSACNKLEPAYLLQIDHIEPVIGVNESLDDISWDTLVDRLWCDEKNLRAICKPCHKATTKIQNAERRRHKKEKGNK